MPTMVFHAAYRLNPESVSGSAIRPIQMKAAFAQAGFEVFDLTGTAKERSIKFRELKSQVKAGKRLDFMYSESATIPPMLGDPNHFPHPFLDAQIFAWFKRNGIPQSVFYRDIYWRFDEYARQVGKPLAAAMRPIYRMELALYRRFMTKIYVPSLQMAAEIPQLVGTRVGELPPGGNNIDAQVENTPIRLLYVGNVGRLYQLHEIVEAVKANPDFFLTICTARDSWAKVKDEYELTDFNNVSIVHSSGDELLELYRSANIAALVVEPSHYRGFAVPVKLFEYVNYGKPIIVSSGTLASQIVADNGWGWVINNDRADIERTLRKLADCPQQVTQATARVLEKRSGHTWVARAKKVAAELSNFSPESSTADLT